MTPPPDSDRLALADPGGQDTRAEWERAAAAVLRKAGRLGEDAPDERVWDALTRTTLDGIGITPLGTDELVADLHTTGRPSRSGEWDIRVPIEEPDPAAANRDLLNDLENGATSLWLHLGPAGVPVADLGAVLQGVHLDAAPVVLDAPDDPLGAARAFTAHARGTRLAEGTNLGVDPVGSRMREALTGSPDGDGAVVADAVGDTVVEAGRLAQDLGCRAVVVDGTVVHDRGASDAQELGYVMAVAATYLRSLARAGLSAGETAALLEFRLAVTDEQFPSIAKLRAARRLWARMLELSGVPEDARGTRLHAVTSRPMMTKYDPWVNMLRTCVGAFAAGIGGADAVTVLPFDHRLGRPDAFSRRIARNTSPLLISETHLARVTDPAGGAWTVEKLTDDLATAGWEELGRFEEDGGPLAGLSALRGRLDAVVAERDRQVATRERPITGLSEFPHLHERLPERAPHPEGRWAVRPWGHVFEVLRDEPVTGKVFLATMGTVAVHTARATFASSLLAAGGVDVVNPGPHEDTAAVVSSYTGPDGGQPVVCLVGNDKAYAAWGAALVAALRDAGAQWVIMAGKPGEKTVPGDLVDDSCAKGVDALAFLERTRERLS